MLAVFGNNVLNASHFAGFEHYFYAVRMRRRFGENTFYKAFRKFTASLMMFLNNFYQQPWFYIFSKLTVHLFAVKFFA